jgi:hypothetical protein
MFVNMDYNISAYFLFGYDPIIGKSQNNVEILAAGVLLCTQVLSKLLYYKEVLQLCS